MQIKIFVLSALMILLFTAGVGAGEITHGEMAGIIRSAEQPCSHVIDLQQTDEHSWKVTCNAGLYYVNKTADGSYSVNAVKKSDQDASNNL